MIRTEDIEKLANEYGSDMKRQYNLTDNDVIGFFHQAKTILQWLDQKDYVIVPDEKIRKEWNYILCLLRNANRGSYKTHYDIGKLFDNLFNKGIFEN
jgi:hypothetical protein